MKSGFRSDAEAAGKQVREILTRSHPKVWHHLAVGSEAEGIYVKWVATWAFHWAAKHLDALPSQDSR
jgi:hypothetical protein